MINLSVYYYNNMDKRFDNKKREKNVTDGRYVKVYDNNVDKALRILKRKVNNDNTLKLLREREFFVSRGERRRREKAIATRRYAKKIEKANLERSSPPRMPRFEWLTNIYNDVSINNVVGAHDEVYKI